MEYFNNLSIKKKMLVVTLPVILIAFAALGGLASMKLKSVTKEETLKQLKVNIGLVNQMITLANSATIVDANEKSAALLKMMPGTFAIDPARSVRIGEQDTPLLSLNGTAMNLNFATVDQFSSAYKK